jgi:hypothetical protein
VNKRQLPEFGKGYLENPTTGIMFKDEHVKRFLLSG